MSVPQINTCIRQGVKLASASDEQDTKTNNSISGLDLDPIMFKLVYGEDGPSWSKLQAIVAEKWYKRFLLLNLKYPESIIVPNKIIDTFWHQHILDTKKYANDCQLIFGYFLHHFPYLGTRGEQDAIDLENYFMRTKDIFEIEFGEKLSSLNEMFGDKNYNASACMGTECGGTACGSTNKICLDESNRPVFTKLPTHLIN